MLNLPTQIDKKGLGFVVGQSILVVAPLKVQGILQPIQFFSGGVIHEEAHAVSEDGDSDYKMDKWVGPTVLGKELANWFAEDVIKFTRYEE